MAVAEARSAIPEAPEDAGLPPPVRAEPGRCLGVFRYVHSRGDGAALLDALPGAAEPESPVAVAQVGLGPPSEGGTRFLAFADRGAMLGWFAAGPGGCRRDAHELIFGRRPQRLKADLDFPPVAAAAWPAALAAAEAALGRVLDAMCDAAADLWLADFYGIARAQVAVLSACGPCGIPCGIPCDHLATTGIDHVSINRSQCDTDSGAPHAACIAQASAAADKPYAEGCEGIATMFKASFHLVAPLAVPTSADARAFTARLVARLAPADAARLDLSVNKTLQAFRMMDSPKMDGSRPLRADRALCLRLGTVPPSRDVAVICAAGDVPVAPAIAPPGGARAGGGEGAGARGGELPGPLAGAVAAAEAAGVAAGHRLRGAEELGDGRWAAVYDRERPTMCRICRRRHDHDNTLRLLLVPHPPPPGANPPGSGAADVTVIELCRRALGEGRVVLRARGDAGRPGDPAGPADPAAAADRLLDEALAAPATAAPATAAPATAAPATAAPATAAPATAAPATATPATAAPAPVAPGAALAPVPPPIAAQQHATAAPVPPPAAPQARAEPGPEGPADDPFAGYEREEYEDAAMRPLPDAPTVVVRAQKGLGKSHAIRAALERIRASEAAAGRPFTARIVTFRRSLKRFQQATFPGFRAYDEIRGPLGGVPALIVQAESLHRCAPAPGDEPPAVLVVDESESVAAQLVSPLHRQPGASFAAFDWLARRARYVIAADADAGELTAALLAGRSATAGRCVLVENRFRAAAVRGDRWLFGRDPGRWLAQLRGDLAAGRRAVACLDSRAEAEAVEALVRAWFPALLVRAYTGATPEATKRADFADVARAWGQADVLIYTSAVSAGVSFEQRRFDVGYVRCTGLTCRVEEVQQMAGRVRDLSTRTYHACVDVRRLALPTDDREILAGIAWARTPPPVRAEPGAAQQRGEGAGQAGPFGLGLCAPPPFSYDDAGRPQYDGPYLRLWLAVARAVNRGRNDFARLLVAQVRATGAAVAREPPPDEAGAAEAAAAGGALAAARARGRAASAAAVAAAEDADDQRADELRAALDGGALGPAEEAAARAAVEKYWLRRAFGLEGDVSPALAAACRRPEALRVCRGLRDACAAPTHAAALELARQRDAAQAAALGPGPLTADATARDLRGEPAGRGPRPYRAADLAAALWALGLCLFTSVEDPARVPLDALRASVERAAAAIAARAPALRRAAGDYSHPGGARAGGKNGPGGDWLADLALLRAVLRGVLGLDVRMSRATARLVRTRTGALFRLVRPAGLRPDACGGLGGSCESNGGRGGVDGGLGERDGKNGPPGGQAEGDRGDDVTGAVAIQCLLEPPAAQAPPAAPQVPPAAQVLPG